MSNSSNLGALLKSGEKIGGHGNVRDSRGGAVCVKVSREANLTYLGSNFFLSVYREFSMLHGTQGLAEITYQGYGFCFILSSI